MPTTTPTATFSTCTLVSHSQEKEKKRLRGTWFGLRQGLRTIVGLTIINARRVLDRDGRLTVTVPETVEATAEDLAAALHAA